MASLIQKCEFAGMMILTRECTGIASTKRILVGNRSSVIDICDPCAKAFDADEVLRNG